MHRLLEDLLAQGPVVTDGAWGTQLQEQGLAIGEFPDVWNLSHPDRVTAVARAYARAGSRIILTNTFGSNRLRLQEQGFADKTADLNRRGVEISCAAAGEAKVFASIGPSAKMLLNGDVMAKDLRQAFGEQAQALAEGGAHGLVIETMSDVEEATLAVEAACETGLPVVACMVFDSGKAKDRTMMGVTPEQAARALSDAGADVIGANCGQGIAGFVSICKRLRAATDRPIWIKANAGMPTVTDGKARYQVGPEEFAGFIPDLVDAGASFIGGCCGTTPAFIEAIRRRVSTRKNEIGGQR
ncbi:MAG TPA: homocysteine S-methyltransferase family protein [Patescibacteria group bacterium]|nr:homocysteine S-methyltransferase family protein [Patescibacteria group bacterium]